jgi:membrane fusion protein (multidrug efflux system)
VFLGGLGLGCKDEKQKSGRSKRKARKFTVQVRTVTPRTLSNDIVAVGTSEPIREVSLTTQVQGSLTTLKVSLGRKVKKGELLARVSTVGLWGESRQVGAELKRLRADLEQAKQELEDTKRLYQQKLVSRKQLDDAKYKKLRLGAQLAQARARLASVGERFRGGTVRAPFAGIIASQGAELGDYVTPGKVIGRLVDLSAVKVTVGLAEVDVVKIRKETRVTVSFPALGEQAHSARILAIAPTADEQTGAFPVEVRVDNRGGALKGGMAARVRFERPGTRGLFVPVEAVVRRGGQPVAFVLREGGEQVEKRTLTLGIRRDGLVQVRAGLAAGDPLVVSGNTRLRDGTKVRRVGAMRPRPRPPSRPGPPPRARARSRSRSRPRSRPRRPAPRRAAPRRATPPRPASPDPPSPGRAGPAPEARGGAGEATSMGTGGGATGGSTASASSGR